MDFWQTVLVLFRRWYVVLPVFLLTIGLAVGVYAAIPVKYVSNAVLVLSAPRGGPTLIADPKHQPGITNPLMDYDQGLSTSASIVIQSLTTPEAALEVGAAPGDATSYQVTNGSTNPELLLSGPFVFIEGDSTASPAAAKDVVGRVVQRAKAELANRQVTVDAPPSTYISLVEVVTPTTPQGQHGGKSRPAAMALGVGLIVSFAAGYAAESMAVTRRKKAEGSPAEERIDEPPMSALRH